MAYDARAESREFVEGTHFALEHLFAALKQGIDARQSLVKDVAEIDNLAEDATGMFRDRDQWSVSANHHYGKLMERLATLEKQRAEILCGLSIDQRLAALLPRFGATEEGMSVLAGAVLQLAKQALSIRFGRKANLPPSRYIGSQMICEVIWEGRNHALHWEDSKPGSPAEEMLSRLQADGLATIKINKNNAFAVLISLGWDSVEHVFYELRDLVA